MAAEEERDGRCRSSRDFDSLYSSIALDLAGRISIGEADSPGAASAGIGSRTTVERFAKGLGCLRRHAAWLDHHRCSRYVGCLLDRQTARPKMGSKNKCIATFTLIPVSLPAIANG